MEKKFTTNASFKEFGLWKKITGRRIPLSFDLEITARCNNNCRHCYINLPAGDGIAQQNELSLNEIEKIADQAIDLGSLWCLISGGEPLLRQDFFNIYIMLKKKGLLVSVFTNASLITSEHITLFKKFPPRDIEVTVYGISKETHEHVTRKSGSFDAFINGFKLLVNNDIKVRLKAMALKSNLHELADITAFCRKYTIDYFRFDPFLHLRYDHDQRRNQEIISERLSADEIVKIEQADPNRSDALQRHCGHYIFDGDNRRDCQHLFRCGAGNGSFTVSPEGYFRLCPSLWHPDCIYDLKRGSLVEAWEKFVLRVRGQTSNDTEFLNHCHSCSIINLCLWCPAHAYLETGQLDKRVEYFCSVANARAKNLKERMRPITEK